MARAKTYDPIDAETLGALQAFAARYSDEDWKAKLNAAWMRSSEPGALQRLRNTHGPSWLAEFELPDPVLPSELRDDDSLSGAFSRFGNPIRVWDEGFGPLWVYRESLGVVGVVRASTWEEAYECVVDEIMGDADMADPDNQPDKDGNLPEGLHWRGNGVPANEGLESPLAAEDLNGSLLDRLTPALVEELGLQIELEED